MFFVEKLSKNIIYAIYNTTEMDNNEKEILEYGALILILKIIGVLMIVIFGVIFNVLIEALIFYFTTCILRKYSGGVHSESPNRCAIISTFVSVFIPLCINRTYNLLSINLINLFIMTIFLVFSYFIILKLTPVDSLAKPIIDIQIREKLKKQSVLTMVIMSCIIFLLIILYINYKNAIFFQLSLCMYFALLWQCFTLTQLGHIIMGKVDNILKYIIRK